MLLDYYYAAEQPLPIEMEHLYRICRAMSGEEQAAVCRVVERFFPVNGTHRHNKRADRELRNSAARIQAAKDNGQRGGRPRREKPSDNPVGLPNITQREPSGLSKQNPAGTQWLTQQKVPFPPHTPPYPQTKNQKPKAKDLDLPLPTSSAENKSLQEVDSPQTKSADPCPHQEIISLYHQHLPMCPNVRLWDERRRRALRTRWREDQERQDVQWWAGYFQYVAKSEFLTGRSNPTNGRAAFVADLEWLIRPANFAKVYEGKYHHG